MHQIRGIDELSTRERKKQRNKAAAETKSPPLKKWQIRLQEKKEKEANQGFEPLPLVGDHVAPKEATDPPAWFVSISSRLQEELNITFEFYYQPWDWYFDPFQGRHTLSRYLHMETPKVKKKKKCTPKINYVNKFFDQEIC